MPSQDPLKPAPLGFYKLEGMYQILSPYWGSEEDFWHRLLLLNHYSFFVELPMQIIYGIPSAIFYFGAFCIIWSEDCQRIVNSLESDYEAETYDYGDSYCTDTDDGVKDKHGDSCQWYNDNEDRCGEFDDSYFLAAAMCCICGGGYRFE